MNREREMARLQILFHESALSMHHRISVNPQLVAEAMSKAGVDESQFKKLKIIIANQETDEDHQGPYSLYSHSYWGGTIVLYPGEMEKVAFHRRVSPEYLELTMNQALAHESKHAGDSTFGKSILVEIVCSLSERLREFRARRFAEQFMSSSPIRPITVAKGVMK